MDFVQTLIRAHLSSVVINHKTNLVNFALPRTTKNIIKLMSSIEKRYGGFKQHPIKRIKLCGFEISHKRIGGGHTRSVFTDWRVSFHSLRPRAVAYPKFRASRGSCAMVYNKAVKNAGVPHLLGRRKERGAVYLHRYSHKNKYVTCT